MYTDTDSLIYHVECDDVYNIIKHNINGFDMSDYSIDNLYDIPLANRKVPGLMKDENNGAIMIEFVGFRVKIYVFTYKERIRKRQRASRASCGKIHNVRRHLMLE